MASASELATAWLRDFEAALKSGGAEGVAALFDDECY
jgi:hypothetical protein